MEGGSTAISRAEWTKDRGKQGNSLLKGGVRKVLVAELGKREKN